MCFCIFKYIFLEVFLLVFTFAYFFRKYFHLYLYLPSKKLKYTSRMAPVDSVSSTKTAAAPYKKAYTVSGSSPYSQERRSLATSETREQAFEKPSPKKFIFEEELNASSLANRDEYSEKVDRIMSTNLASTIDKW
jgi:hypothetical protein